MTTWEIFDFILVPHVLNITFYPLSRKWKLKRKDEAEKQAGWDAVWACRKLSLISHPSHLWTAIII